MPKLQRFKGQNADEVRTRVLAAVGPDVDIVRAGRERSGGVLGFFAKEEFVLDVAVPDPPERTDNAAEMPAAATGALRTLEAVADETTDVVSISSNRFAETFSTVLEEAEAAIASRSTDANVTAPQTAPVNPAPVDTAPVDTAPLDTAPIAMPPVAVPPVVAPPDVAAPETELVVPPSHDRRTPLEQETPPWSARHLERLGLDASLLVTSQRRLDLALIQVFARLDERAPSPAADPGSVVIVLGQGRRVLQLASSLEARMGTQSGAVVRVSLRTRARDPQVLCGALAAAQEVAARRIDGAVTVLAVDLGNGPLPFHLVQLLVAGVRPDAVWVCLAASVTRDDLDETRKACGRLDAIALYDLDSAAQPAALVGAGVPIAYLDGHEATPLMWSARLYERVSREVGR